MIYQSASTPNKPEMLLAAVLHLMSHYSSHSARNKDQNACVKLAAVIERHLTMLSELPDLGPVYGPPAVNYRNNGHWLYSTPCRRRASRDYWRVGAIAANRFKSVIYNEM